MEKKLTIPEAIDKTKKKIKVFSKRGGCRACEMLADGVKFRRAPRHTCDLGNINREK